MGLGKKSWPDRLLISKVSTNAAPSDKRDTDRDGGEFGQNYEEIFVQR